MESYLTAKSFGKGEVIEKKSRFIAEVTPISREDEASDLIQQTRKKYYDAKHHCYAYILSGETKKTKISDDKEPQGTAGRPILDVLLGRNICDTIVIVTRYFGGILLGTGGLSRAYGEAAMDGIAHTKLCIVSEGIRADLTTDYGALGSIKRLLEESGARIEDEIYSDKVKFTISIKKESYEAVRKSVIDITLGKAVWQNERDEKFLEDV